MNFKVYVSIVFTFLFIGPAFFNEAALADDKAKIVFISGKPSHGPMAHEHRAGNMILADALNRSGLDVEAVLVPALATPKISRYLTERSDRRDFLHRTQRTRA